jgi:hypothetical protein
MMVTPSQQEIIDLKAALAKCQHELAATKQSLADCNSKRKANNHAHTKAQRR